MPSASFQDVSNSDAQPNAMVQPLTAQIHRRFAQFCHRHPHSSLIAALERGPVINGAEATEYVVRATIRVEGRTLVSSLAAAATIEEAEDRARLRSIALAEAITSGSASTADSDFNISNRDISNRDGAISGQVPVVQAVDHPASQSHGSQSGNDGLGDTMVNLGGLEGAVGQDEFAEAPIKKTKPKSKSGTQKSVAPAEAAVKTAPSEAAAIQPEQVPAEAIAHQPAQKSPEKFVADWSEDLAQIAIELKRLNWSSQQEQEYLQRTFDKSSRDDIVDHRELMDYLGYLQALPSHFETVMDGDETSIAEVGLSMDEADLAPQSVTELIASAGLKSGADISTPQPAEVPAIAETDCSIAPSEGFYEPVGHTSANASADAPIADASVIREPEPEIEITASETDALELDSAATQPPLTSLSRGEMMDETARLCKRLGWKNRQGSDFLKATYNKATRKDLTDAEMMDFLEQLRSLSTTEALPY